MTNSERIAQAKRTYEEISVFQAGKRCGVQWTPWMGDWFTSWSPRNSNSNAEGPWDHWVDLALAILKDPLTEKIRPGLRAAVASFEPIGFYSDVATSLSDDDLIDRFKDVEP